MGIETARYRDRVIKIAKSEYLDTFIRSSPDKNNYTIDDNVISLSEKNSNEFMLEIIDSWCCTITEKSFKYSDF